MESWWLSRLYKNIRGTFCCVWKETSGLTYFRCKNIRKAFHGHSHLNNSIGKRADVILSDTPRHHFQMGTGLLSGPFPPHIVGDSPFFTASDHSKMEPFCWVWAESRRWKYVLLICSLRTCSIQISLRFKYPLVFK